MDDRKLMFDRNTTILCSKTDHEGVREVAGWVRDDLRKVFGEPSDPAKGIRIIAGTCGKSGAIAELVRTGEFSAEGLFDAEGKARREVFKIVPLCDAEHGNTIVIAGSDKRGTMYGLLSVSELCGVTPLVNWSGASPARKETVEIPDSFFRTSKEPSVKYRGIFINDEYPAFGTWAKKRFGGVNAECYATVFEFLVRLHANYMWPAMWADNFSMDGPGLKSAELADKLGIVMSTSHHEPCMRTGEEYRLLRGPGSVYGDAWDFLSNREGITRFWEDGLKRNAPFENVYTMGMRGERDTAIMAQASLKENIALLKDIIRTQNELIRKNVDPDLSKVPRQIVLFTEVEKFYYGDENTPGLIDDPELEGITVMFSDSNYGYTRTLPTAKMRQRKGGYGLYYHVDMHGGAYSYEWIGSTYLPRIRDQLRTAYDFGVRDIWVVNVGDIVSQELEISYIMKLANDVEAFSGDGTKDTETFIENWIGRIFGAFYSPDDLKKIKRIIDLYTKINERRKHEIMNTKVYHPVHFGEARILYEDAKEVMRLCDELLQVTPDGIRTAFYELIRYPAYGTANLHRTWAAAMWNGFYADENRNTANDYNAEIDEGIRADEKLIEEFHALADGKFYGHALSEHFGFRFWNDSNNQLPRRQYIYPAAKKRMLVSKSDEAWYLDGREYTKRDEEIFDFLNPKTDRITLEVSCGSREEITYRITKDVPWLILSSEGGTTGKTDEITVSVDRKRIGREERTKGTLVVSDLGECFVSLTFYACGEGYCESVCGGKEKIPENAHYVCGYGAAEALHYVRLTRSEEGHYEILRPYGRTLGGLKLAPSVLDLSGEERKEEELPFAEYAFIIDHDADVRVDFVFAPSLPVDDSNSQYFAYGMNNDKRVRINTVLDPERPVFNSPQWRTDNRHNVKIITVTARMQKGVNFLRYYQLSPNLILERIELWESAFRYRESYMGPPET